MPSRLQRFQTSGHGHFVTFTCYHRLPYLDNDHARTLFLEVIEKLRTRHQFFVFGYALMPEHVHLLLSEPKAHILATTLNALKAVRRKRQARPDFGLSQLRRRISRGLTKPCCKHPTARMQDQPHL